MVKHYDLAVIGGGSGGFAAALAAARLGVKALVVEKGDCLGGTSTLGGVNCWEPGAGGTGIPFDLYLRLKRVPNAVGICSIGRHGMYYRKDRDPYRFPGGIMVVDPHFHYADTLRRYGPIKGGADEAFCRKTRHGVPFEPRLMADEMLKMLQETGRCEVLLNTTFKDVAHDSERVRSIGLSNGEAVSADAWVDGTGDGLLCAAAGCEGMVGQEARGRFNEPAAPETANRRVNGVTLIFRVRGRALKAVDPLPADVPEKCWWHTRFPSVHVITYPNGDLNLNMLPTMEGVEYLKLGPAAAYAECRRRALAQWHYLQAGYEEFQSYEMCWIAPMLGVREGRRIVGEHVLTENDLRAGCSGEKHPDIVAIADHAMDTHGASTGRAGCGELPEPYGVPYRCLIPKGFKDLLIACRGAGFSSLAASSCRLIRTMMMLGQAAGTAVALAKRLGLSLPEVPPDGLRQALRDQHAQVDWPTPPDLARYLRQDEAM
jgi:hypothetical protein